MRSIFFIAVLFPAILYAQANARLADSVSKGFRGLSIPNHKLMWMSGQKGLVGVTKNGGKKWKWHRVKGFENSDFRSIYAFDKKNAVIANAGYPASILRTSNGGKTWTTVFQSKDSAMFFDGIDFWNAQHGLIFGDPIHGKMYLAETYDGGKTWKEIPLADRPSLKEGEASFAASGTTIRVHPGGHVWIATGGSVSRLWHSRDYGHHWEVFETPILQGKPSQGIFSFAFFDTLKVVIVGGDYLNDTLMTDNCFLSDDGGKSWTRPKVPPYGYRSCVEFICSDWLMAVGTNGTDSSTDGGVTWVKGRNNIGYNTVQIGRGGLGLAQCGGNGGFRFQNYFLLCRGDAH